MSYSQTVNQTHRSFQIYVSPTITNAAVGNTLIYTHDQGMGTLFITGVYFYADSQSGTAGTLCTINVGINSPSYSSIVTSGSTSNGGSNYQIPFTLTDTANPIIGVKAGEQIYARINRTGTNFITGSIILVGYHSANPGDVLSQDS